MDFFKNVTSSIGRFFNPTGYNQVAKQSSSNPWANNQNNWAKPSPQNTQGINKNGGVGQSPYGPSNIGNMGGMGSSKGGELYKSMAGSWGGSGSNSQNEYDQKMIQYMKSQPNPVDVYNRAANESGLSGLEAQRSELNKSIMGIESKLSGLDEEITKNTSGFLVKESARQGLVGAAEKPLRKQYAELAMKGRGIDEGISNASKLTSLLVSKANQDYSNEGEMMRALKSIADRNESSGSGYGMDIGSALGGTGGRVSNSSASLNTQSIDTKGLPSKPLSKDGLAGKVTYSTQSGQQVKWSPVSGKWVSTNSGNQSTLNKIWGK